jgi:hypothetical protein
MVYNEVELTENEIDFISKVVLGPSMAWYKQDFQTDFEPNNAIKDSVGNNGFFGHALMLRNTSDPTVPGNINSEYYHMFENIFYRWIKQNNLELPNKIYRAGLNLTLHNDKDFSVPHYDHEWPHWNWIMYLNDNDAATLLFDTDYNITQQFPAKKFHACAFENTLHAHQFPKINEFRYVVVFTFI